MSSEEPSATLGGIYDRFEGYRTPTPDDVNTVLTSGLVVLDTNVLLNLYRYNAESRQAMLDVLTALGDRLWIPHQVMKEFWRNRERALSDPRTDVAESISKLRNHRDAIVEVVSQWVNRAALNVDVAAGHKAAVAETVEAVINELESLVDPKLDQARNTANDTVLSLLEPVLEGHIGAAMAPDAYRAAIAEGQRRADAGEPPGFGDAKTKADRGPEGAAGDFLVWEQLLLEASKRLLDVLLVTGDVNKGDWWRREGASARGPRNELVQELKHRAGTRLFMLRPEELLARARTALSVHVKDESVQDVERADRSWSRPTDELEASTGWTPAALEELLYRLARQAPVQGEALRVALAQDGFVSREDVYRIGEYGPERQLKGFTRPINRLVQQLRDEGHLAHDAEDVLQPVYEHQSHGFGWVDGFRVPAQIVELVAVGQFGDAPRLQHRV
ncbi:MAG: PIN-like domain-containing protein [Actinomycetes bacterium]